MAERYAGRHLKTDQAVLEIHFLPEGAPANEIRLVEVNKLVSESTPLEPINFGVETGGNGAHTLYVLDVTPTQWQAICSGKTTLPSGWSLENSVTIRR